MPEHDAIPIGEIHVAHNYQYANAAARLAAVGFVPADVGKLALQLDTYALWILTDDSPVTWQAVGGSGGGGTPGGSDTQIQFNDATAFGGDADLTWNKTTNTLTLDNSGSAQPTVDVDGQTALRSVAGSVGLGVHRDGGIQWSSSSGAWNAAIDTALYRGQAGLLKVAASIGGTIKWIMDAGCQRVSADFTKSANTTLGNITGASAALLVDAGSIFNTFAFHFEANVDADATGGFKFAVAYSGSLYLGLEYYIEVINDSTGVRAISSRQTTSGGAAGAAGPTAVHVRITGSVGTASAGNLTVQFAQNAASGTSTVRNMGSFFRVTPLA